MSKSPEPECAPADFADNCGTSLPSDHVKVTALLCEIEEAEYNVKQLRTEMSKKKNSMQMLLAHMKEMDQKKAFHLKESEKLRQRVDSSDRRDAIRELTIKLELLKALEKEESYLQSAYKNKHPDVPSKLKLEVSFVDEGCHDSINIAESLSNSLHKLHLAKKELAIRLREILSLKKRYDDTPTQPELIQYEHRFSELDAQIQEKHCQTRKHYATYNALLEIKELMLKETSLLNSINSQFREAMSSTTGRSKLVDSMEVIVKGTKQKLEKVQLTLIAEQEICDAIKEENANTVTEQRQFSSLLKAIQEECARNEKLRRLASM